MPKIEPSLVVPMYNESECIDEFFASVIPVLDHVSSRYEIVCVNDGSSEDTLARLLAVQKRVPEVVVVDLARNFGKEAALSAGLDHARGAAVVPIDADLQDPPALIEEFVRLWREGYEVLVPWSWPGEARRSREDEHSASRSWPCR